MSEHKVPLHNLESVVMDTIRTTLAASAMESAAANLKAIVNATAAAGGGNNLLAYNPATSRESRAINTSLAGKAMISMMRLTTSRDPSDQVVPISWTTQVQAPDSPVITKFRPFPHISYT